MRHPSRALWIVVLLVLGLTVAGCAQQTEPPAETPAAQTTMLPGSEVEQITLSKDAVRAVGIETQPVTADKSGGVGPSTVGVIPITALIYDPEGKPWTYTMTPARTFVRQPVVIARIESGSVYLSAGPPVGTPVVSVVAASLQRKEYGVGEE